MTSDLPASRTLDSLPAWERVEAAAREHLDLRLEALFAAEPQRCERMVAQACGITLDFARARIGEHALESLLAVVEQADLGRWREAMFDGAPVNQTEGRAALHVALRHAGEGPFPGPGRDVMPQVREVLERTLEIAERFRARRWPGATGEAVTDLVNIGIGGSDLGPRMACRALRAHDRGARRVHFVASLDAAELAEALDPLDPARTLFVITSKTFTTQETLRNALSARAWIVDALGPEAPRAHFLAVTASPERAVEFGIDAGNCLPLWDWVGGRFSMWSAVGLPVAAAIGAGGFRSLLAGARAMDRHFREAPARHNLPVLSALLGIWHARLLGAQSRAVLPYDHALRDLPGYLQQLEMESNGKRVGRGGEPLGYPTAPVLWGGSGNNGQHAFFQALHQGLQPVACEVLVAARGQREREGHQEALIANALAQLEALASGRDAAQARDELRQRGASASEAERLAPHLVLPGNHPSTVLLYRRLDPYTLGALIALYEHRVFVEAVCWGINPFDQWGVEVGKKIAGRLAGAVAGETGTAAAADDPATGALLRRILRLRAATGEEQE